LLAIAWPVAAIEPVKPLPLEVEHDDDLARLGQLLFFDPVLSNDRTVSCSSCHDPNHGGADPRPVSTGVHGRKGRINAPSVFNAYFNFRQFWDGRARDLSEQADAPIHNPGEMDMSRELVEKRLGESPLYREKFRQIYGRDEIRYDDVINAIVEFEKTLITPNSRFDRYLRGELELEPLEKEGYLLFKQLGCIACHNGVNIGGNSFQYLGAVVPLDEPTQYGDLYARTGDPFDHNRFKVPSLRNVALTAPYMHDGRHEKLEDALYTMAYHNLGFELNAAEIEKLVAFLNTLTGEMPELLRTE